MTYKLAIINTSTEGIEHVSNVLVAVGIGGFEVCDSADFKEFLDSCTPAYDYVDESLLALSMQRSVIKFYVADNVQGDMIIDDVEKALINLKNQDMQNCYGTLEMNVNTVDDSDWKDNWKKYYKPIEIGDNFIVSPAWEDTKTDKILLKIDPGMAFGTGSHETTSLCLELLQKENLKNKKVLDVGCGSGILSQAAVLFGADNSVGIDIDEAAVSCAKSNAKINNLENKVTYYQGDLLENTNGKFEVVVANIVADIVIALTSDISKVITKDGIYISSGIIAERADEVARHISNCGFEILKIKERRGWAAIVACYK